MPGVVKLRDIIDALEYPEEWEALLDPTTGEIITVTGEERDYLEDGEADDEDLPEWQRESLEHARRALESTTMLRLPDKFEIHEWDIMRRFAGLQNEPASSELYNAIHGTGAFRMFRSTVDRLNLREAWYEYRAATFERIARDWLEQHGIPYEE
jgi:hypothetical protein